MKKRILSMLLAVTMLLSVVPIGSFTAFAYDEASQFKKDNITYNRIEIEPANRVIVAEVDSSIPNVVIPEYVTDDEGNEYTVTAISYYAFRDKSGITSVSVPDTVTEIGETAFEECLDLESVNIPGSVQKIPRYAFYGCQTLESVMISNGVTTIDEMAFAGCKSLKSIALPESITTIHGSAFNGCPELALTINKPEAPTLVDVGSNTFYNVNSLKIYVPYESGDAYKTAAGWSNFVDKIEALPPTIAYVLSMNPNFPTSAENAWMNEDEDTVYLCGDKLLFGENIEVSLEQSVTESGNTFVSSDGRLIFTMDNGKLVSIELKTGLYFAGVYSQPFTVTFDLQGYNGTTPDPQKVINGGKATKPADPTNDANIFGGWYDNKECSGDAFDFENTAISGNITLYAKWTFAPAITNGTPEGSAADNHGYITVDKTQEVPGKTVTVTVTPDDDYGLASLKVYETPKPGPRHELKTVEITQDKNNPAKYTFTMPAFAVTVKAEFTELYTVTFDMQGHGGTAPEPQKVINGGEATKPEDPTDPAYVFLYWWYEDIEVDEGYKPEFDFKYIPITGNITLYARWEPAVATLISDGTTTLYARLDDASIDSKIGDTITLMSHPDYEAIYEDILLTPGVTFVVDDEIEYKGTVSAPAGYELKKTKGEGTTVYFTEPRDYTLILSAGKAYKNTVAKENEIGLPLGLSYADGGWTMENFYFATTAATAVRFNEATTLELVGGNTVASGNTAGDSCGMYVKDALTVVGAGNLHATGGKAGGNSYGISASDMKVEDGLVYATGGKAGDRSAGISASDMRVENSVLNVTGGKAGGRSAGISASDMRVENSVLIVTGGESTSGRSAGIYVTDNIIVSIDDDGFIVDDDIPINSIIAGSIVDGIIVDGIIIADSGTAITAESATVTITGGSISGETALELIDCVSEDITVSGGSFTGTITSAATDGNLPATGFITGGIFSEDPSDYVPYYAKVEKQGSNYAVTMREYSITNSATGDGNGYLTISRESAVKGDTVTITVSPEDGYGLVPGTLKVNKTDGSELQAESIIPKQNLCNSTKYTFTMPGYDVTVEAQFEGAHTVTFDLQGHGGTAPDLQKVISGDMAKRPFDPMDDEYIFSGWYENEECSGDAFDFENTAITEALTLYAKWTFAPAVTNGAPVNDAEKNYGYLTINKTQAVPNETVTVAVTPYSGYKLKANTLKVTYNDGKAKTCTLKAGENNTYTFTMPAYAVTVTAEFEEVLAFSEDADGKYFRFEKNGDKTIIVFTVENTRKGLNYALDYKANENDAWIEGALTPGKDGTTELSAPYLGDSAFYHIRTAEGTTTGNHKPLYIADVISYYPWDTKVEVVVDINPAFPESELNNILAETVVVSAQCGDKNHYYNSQTCTVSEVRDGRQSLILDMKEFLDGKRGSVSLMLTVDGQPCSMPVEVTVDTTAVKNDDGVLTYEITDPSQMLPINHTWQYADLDNRSPEATTVLEVYEGEWILVEPFRPVNEYGVPVNEGVVRWIPHPYYWGEYDETSYKLILTVTGADGTEKELEANFHVVYPDDTELPIVAYVGDEGFSSLELAFQDGVEGPGLEGDERVIRIVGDVQMEAFKFPTLRTDDGGVEIICEPGAVFDPWRQFDVPVDMKPIYGEPGIPVRYVWDEYGGVEVTDFEKYLKAIDVKPPEVVEPESVFPMYPLVGECTFEPVCANPVPGKTAAAVMGVCKKACITTIYTVGDDKAAINGNTGIAYDTLEAAITDAAKGDTVYNIASVSENITLPAGVKFVANSIYKGKVSAPEGMGIITNTVTTGTEYKAGYPITNGTPESDAEENHGYITIDKTYAAEGDTVTVTVNPAKNYKFKALNCEMIPETKPLSEILATVSGGFPKEESGETTWWKDNQVTSGVMFQTEWDLRVGEPSNNRGENIDLESPLEKYGEKLYKYSQEDGYIWYFCMNDGVLEAIILSGEGPFAGTYTPAGTPLQNPYSIETDVTFATQTEGTYTFTMPDCDVTVTAEFEFDPPVKFTKTQAQWEDNAAGKWNLGIVGTFNTDDIPIAFDEKGTSNNVSAVGVIIRAGEKYEQQTTRFVYATENENEYCYRAVIKNIPYNVSSEKTITVQFFATVDGKEVLGETKTINFADAYATAINNGMPAYEG